MPNNLVGPDDVPRLEPLLSRAPVYYMDAIALASKRTRTRHLTGTDQWKAVMASGRWPCRKISQRAPWARNCFSSSLRSASYILYMGQVLGGKATSTLSKRVGQVARYYRWCDVASLDYFPITRAKIHGYVDAIRAGRGAPGRVKGFLEVLAFMVHVLGFDIPLDEASDPWVKGVTRELMAARPPRRQARPLLCQELLALEAALTRGLPLRRVCQGESQRPGRGPLSDG